MDNTKKLEQRLNELEVRLKTLEEKFLSSTSNEEAELMAALYEKAKELVIKHRQASAVFLQRRLVIDYERARQLLEKLEADKIIGPDLGLVEPRKILVKR